MVIPAPRPAFLRSIESDAAETKGTMDSTITTVDITMEIEPARQAEGIIDPPLAGTTTGIEMAVNSSETVRVLNMGGNNSDRMKRMMEQGRSILTLCRNSCGGIAPERAEEMSKRFADACLYLDWLDTNVEMTPRINSTTKIDRVLADLIKPSNNVPEEMANKAKELLNKYEADNWGQDVVAEEDSAPQAASTEAPTIGEIQLPAANDPVFGVGGIMYGIIIDTSGKRRDYRLRVDIPRRSAKAYGDNGVALGAWFPFQINAIFWGAHGARMGGIAGSVITGAWSIVVAGTYEDLDTDGGETLYYSGSNSHENTNPRQPAPSSQGTKALHASIISQNPVRVLRSGGASNVKHQNEYLPICGLRYDGLYRVVHCRHRQNKKGGLYEQFKLERLPGQTPLGELQRTSPTTEQIIAHDRLRSRS
ncbi:PUA-like domain-containing protein [Nemania abortiva]|nr:PUA-like domain-containing protein [Nemania abortiva]